MAAVVFATLLLCPSMAAARPWTTSYDWTAAQPSGYEGWRGEEGPAGDGQPGPFYDEATGGSSVGLGLAVVPLGGRVYGNGDASRPDGGPAGRLVLDAPGASTFTTVRWGGARFRNQSEGQVFRLRLGRSGGPNDTRDYFPGNGFPVDQDNTLGQVALAVPEGATRTEMGLLTTCRGAVTPGQPPYECPEVDSSSRSFGQVTSAQLTLDDPDLPGIEVAASPPITGGWESRSRARSFRVRASDASSGVRRIRLTVQSAGATRVLLDRTVGCDPGHRTPGRGALECPPEAQATGRDPGVGGGGERRYSVTVTDFAGNQSEQTLVVLRDPVAPSGAALVGRVGAGPGRWTNRRAAVPVRLSARDALSGVARLELQAIRQGAGRASTLVAVQPDCSRDCRQVSVPAQADLGQLTRDGVYRLQVVATDQAGNARTVRVPELLRIDRTAPRRSGASPTYRVLRDGRIRITLTPSRDPSPGSGLRRYLFRYYPAPASSGRRAATPRFASVTPTQLRAARPEQLRFRGSRSRNFTFRPENGIDRSRPAALVSLDGAEGALAPFDIAGGDFGNVLDRSAVRLRGAGGTSAQDLYDAQGIEKLERYANTAAKQSGRGAGPSALRGALGKLGKILGRASFAAAAADFFVNVDSAGGCDSFRPYVLLNQRARRVNEVSGQALARGAARGIGAAPRARTLLRSAIRRVRSLNGYARLQRSNNEGSSCVAAAKVALRTDAKLGPALKAALAVAERENDQLQRRRANKQAAEVSRNKKYGEDGCRESDSIAKRFGGPGRGRSNYVVYWSPPPPLDEDVDYIGISRALPSRCATYRRKPATRARAGNLRTLRLPHMRIQEAREVEEALIAHFGPNGASRNGGGDAGQLSNLRHEISPDRPEYCIRLLRGQFVLKRNGYGRYAAALYTRTKRCPGVGGPR